MNKREHPAYRKFPPNLHKVLLHSTVQRGSPGGTKQGESIASNPTAFMFLSCVVETLLQRRLMLPKGKVLFGMLLLQAGVQELRPGFHKENAGATSDGTFCNTKSLKEVSLYWKKFYF